MSLRCEVAGTGRYQSVVRSDARRLLRLLSLENCELSLVLTGDAQIRALNRTFRGHDSETDVLSFPQFDEGEPLPADPRTADAELMTVALGDIVLSIETARRQAKRMEVTAESRLRTLLIHGMLHLLGYDHEKSPAQARRMFARERELAARLTSRQKPLGPAASASNLPVTARPS